MFFCILVKVGPQERTAQLHVRLHSRNSIENATPL